MVHPWKGKRGQFNGAKVVNALFASLDHPHSPSVSHQRYEIGTSENSAAIIRYAVGSDLADTDDGVVVTAEMTENGYFNATVTYTPSVSKTANVHTVHFIRVAVFRFLSHFTTSDYRAKLSRVFFPR